MKGLYLLAFSLSVLWLITRLVRRPREGILCGLVATALCPEALPLNLIDGIGLASQLGFLVLSFMYLLLRGWIRRTYVANPYNVSIAFFAVVMMAYVFVSTAKEYGTSKVYLFFLKSIAPVFLLSAMAPFSRRELRLGFYALIGASLLAALSLLTSGTFGLERATTADINAISVGRAIGCGGVLLIGFVVTGKESRSLKVLWAIALASVCLVAMVATGSRGPIAALVVAVVALVLVVPMSLKKRLATLGKFGLFVGTVIAGTIYYGVGSILQQLGGFQRIVLKLGQLGSGTSDQARLHRISVAIDEFIQSKGLGIGTGEFLHAYPYGKGAARDYPHNLFIEAATEQGVVGLLLVLVILGSVVIKFYKFSIHHRDNIFIKISYILFLYGFANSMVSGDIPMNVILWVAGGLLWLTVESETERDVHSAVADPSVSS